jgi:hypothetical protein
MVNEMITSSDAGKTLTLTAVYIPFKTFLTAVTTFAGGAIPNKLDKSAWPTFSNLLQGQTYSAFKFLGLIDNDGYVQPVLKDLAKEQPESAKFKTTLAQILKEKYKSIIELASQNGTINQLQEAMRGYQVSGTTLERAIRFWTEAAKSTGIPFPDSWKRATGGIVKRHKSGAAAPEVDKNKPVDEKPPVNPPLTPESGYTKKMKLSGGIGDVTLIVSVNPIELKGTTRTWFYDLIDKLDECPPEV